MSRRDELLRYFLEQKEETGRRVSDGIEKYRKGNVSLVITDRSGRPVPNARVHAEQIKHSFLFGCNLYGLDQLETPEKNALYRERFKEAFNMATLPIYWSALEPEEGKPRFSKDSPFIYRRPPLDLCLEFCEENGITPKAHCLNYFQRGHYPAWCPDNDNEKVKQLCEKRFRELAERYRGRIPQWEVINETLGSFILPDNPAIFRMPDSIEWSFELARKYFPDNKLIINEDPPSTFGDQRGDRSTYYLQIERALGRGATIDAIGLQSHILYERSDPRLHSILTDPSKLFSTLDLYGRFGLPLQITEITLAIFSDLAEDEEAQAELLRAIYSVYFSHRSVEAIVFWDLADGYTPGAGPGEMNAGWNAFRGSLLRYDLSEKPAFRELKRLVNEEWHTDAAVLSDENGRCGFRGFRGKYRLYVEADGGVYEKTADFSGADNEMTLSL